MVHYPCPHNVKGKQMKQVRVDNNFFIPMPVALIGCTLHGRANFMTAGWITRVNAVPPQIGIGIHHSHATPEGIKESKTFSVCFPPRTLLVETDYCGLASGKDGDKSALFNIFHGELKTAPMIEEASVNLECSLVQTVEGPSNYFFIGEIKGAFVSEECLEGGRVDPERADYLFLTMMDNNYWALGEKVGKAWHMGRDLIKK
jgi:flavin reductase (DIM6/NTAB) family NADH-FMN oxidoreductase RutF